MGQGASSLSAEQKKIIEEKVKKGDKLDDLKFIPSEDVLKRLKVAQDLLEKYNSNDIVELKTVIENNKENLGEMDENVKKQINEFNSYLSKDNRDRTGKMSNFETFYKFLKEIEQSELNSKKTEIVNQTFLGDDQKKVVESIFNNISTMKAKEQFYKYEYLLTQIWLVNHTKNLNTAVTEFVDKTTKLVMEHEEFRNQYVRNMLNTIQSILTQSQLDLDEKDFEPFRKQLASFQDVMNKQQEALEKEIQDSKAELQNTVVQGMGQAMAAQQGGAKKKAKKPKQKGGFLRDHSMLPQAFYDLA